MESIWYLTDIILAGMVLAAVIVGGWMLRKKKYRKAVAAGIAVLVMVLAGGTYGVCQLKEISSREADDRLADYSASAVSHAELDYQKAVDILSQASLKHLDKNQLDTAARSLHTLSQSPFADKLAAKCPDVEVLSAYADMLRLAAVHEDGLDAQKVCKDDDLVAAAQAIPVEYKGKLSDKILPARQYILALKAEGDRQADLDAKNMAKHKEALAQGEYGKIVKGDPESRLTACLGEPVRVNKNQDGADLKQYVFQHEGRNIYVYTKDGVVTDIYGL